MKHSSRYRTSLTFGIYGQKCRKGLDEALQVKKECSSIAMDKTNY